MEQTWILVADASRARLFSSRPGEPLQELADYQLPEGRMKDSQLQQDAKGRYFGKGERVMGHTAEPRVDPIAHAEDLFAKSLAEHLEQGRQAHRFGKLVLVAAPKFLGRLRAQLPKDLERLVVKSVDKDFSSEDVRGLQQRLVAEGALAAS